MTAGDARAVLDAQRDAFLDLDRRLGRDPDWPSDDAPGLVRMRHVVATDPGGAWVAEKDGRIAGCALSILREGIWGLSLLVVVPEHQGSGIGRRLLERALAYGNGARGGIILSSDDARAAATYARAGFSLHPTIAAKGPVRRRLAASAGVREGRWPADRRLIDEVSRAVRGAAHGDDIGALIAAGRRLLVHEDGGWAVCGGWSPIVAATQEPVAADLLRACLASGSHDTVEYIAAGNDWAVEVALDAGLRLHPCGPMFTRGEAGPMRPYLPSGAYL